MYHVIPEAEQSAIVVRNPAAFLRAFACTVVLGLPPPTESQVKWAESQAEEFKYGTEFWSPYGQFRRAFYMRPWAIALLNFLPGKSVEPVHLARIDPASFYHEFPALVKQIDPTDSLASTAAQAHWLGSVEGARAAGDEQWAGQLEILHAEVRIAAHNGTLILSPRKIKSFK